MNGQLDLQTLQRWFAAVVEHVATADIAVRSAPARRHVPLRLLRAGEVIEPNPRMAATDQLQVYNGGYLTRLVEVLQGDFGGVHHVLGDDEFRALAARYLAAHPSRHPNLNQLGKHFASFVQKDRRLPHRAFLAELARLEWALCRAFDAPEFTALTTAELQAVPPDGWARVKLVGNPSVHLVETRYPVGAWYRTWKEGLATAIPEPEPAWTLVFRRDDKVWRQRLEEPQFAMIEALLAGRTLGAAIECTDGDARVGEWLQEFARDGLFVAVRQRARKK